MSKGVGDSEETADTAGMVARAATATHWPTLVLAVSPPDEAPTMHTLTEKRSFVLGRAEGCDIHIPHTSVSRRHALLSIHPLGLTDLESRNGTRIDGRALRGARSERLEAGQSFQLGNVLCRVNALAAHDAPLPPSTHAHAPIVAARAMKELFATMETVAPSRLPILILGETGVGKEVVAREVHARSARTAGPFLSLNCAALPATILDGELFGHEKGAFTGAHEARPGLFEAAHGGTIFLDEVGEMPLETQAKLLRVLEGGEVLRLGSRRPTKIDVRFLAATNRDLAAMVAAGTFRQDLYYRINGIALEVPPLRERREEIPELADSFLARIAPGKQISASARDALVRYEWPGNVRELRNVIERGAILAGAGAVETLHLRLPDSAADVPPRRAMALTIPPPPDAMLDTVTSLPDLHEEVREFERTRILEALESAAGNQTRAAELLGMSRFALMKRLSDLNIGRPRKR